jgi:hypothetical protein
MLSICVISETIPLILTIESLKYNQDIRYLPDIKYNLDSLRVSHQILLNFKYIIRYQPDAITIDKLFDQKKAFNENHIA